MHMYMYNAQHHVDLKRLTFSTSFELDTTTYQPGHHAYVTNLLSSKLCRVALFNVDGPLLRTVQLFLARSL